MRNLTNGIVSAGSTGTEHIGSPLEDASLSLTQQRGGAAVADAGDCTDVVIHGLELNACVHRSNPMHLHSNPLDDQHSIVD